MKGCKHSEVPSSYHNASWNVVSKLGNAGQNMAEYDTYQIEDQDWTTFCRTCESSSITGKLRHVVVAAHDFTTGYEVSMQDWTTLSSLSLGIVFNINCKFTRHQGTCLQLGNDRCFQGLGFATGFATWPWSGDVSLAQVLAESWDVWADVDGRKMAWDRFYQWYIMILISYWYHYDSYDIYLSRLQRLVTTLQFQSFSLRVWAQSSKWKHHC